MSRMQTKSAGRRARRRFAFEFKVGTVRSVLDEGKTIGVVAHELDLTPSSLGVWLARAQADRTRGEIGLTSGERGANSLKTSSNHTVTEWCTLSELDFYERSMASSAQPRMTNPPLLRELEELPGPSSCRPFRRE
jgi:transposase-like protein